jgi:hypothetical protein
MSDFGSLKTSAMAAIVASGVALCLPDSAWAAARGGFGGCDGWGGIYCDNNNVAYAPQHVYYEAIYVEGPAFVYVPRYYFPRSQAVAHHYASRHRARYRACR